MDAQVAEEVGRRALACLKAMLDPDTVMAVDPDHRPDWVLSFRGITSATDQRTTLATVRPHMPASHQAPIIDPFSLLGLPAAVREAIAEAEAEAAVERQNPRLF